MEFPSNEFVIFGGAGMVEELDSKGQLGEFRHAPFWLCILGFGELLE